MTWFGMQITYIVREYSLSDTCGSYSIGYEVIDGYSEVCFTPLQVAREVSSDPE
jgi:hypothetical protein